MAIMVGNGSNAGSLSPFAPTGIIVNGLMTRNNLGGFETQTYLANLFAHAAVAFGGYFLFGGLKLFRSSRFQVGRSLIPTLALPITAADRAFNPRQWTTLAVIGLLLVGVIFFNLNVGFGAFVCAVVLVLARCADDGEALKKMPWRVIVMVTGVTVLISILEKAQGIDLVVSWVAKISTAHTVTGVVAFIVGVISVYSSTSGVVLPAFLPMVPGLAQQLGVTHALSIRECDERGRTSRRRLAAIHHRRVVHRRRSCRRQPPTVQQADGVGAFDVSRRRADLLGRVLEFL